MKNKYVLLTQIHHHDWHDRCS